MPTDGLLTQDFVMINQPGFAFSNVDDYRALSQVLQDHEDDPELFFKERTKMDPADRTKPDLNDPQTARTLRTLQIVKRVQSTSLLGPPPVFQPPPASPVDNQYFSAAPFLFGEDRVMKFTADPAYRSLGEAPDVSDPDYLRKALLKRLTGPDARPIVFHFRVQLRTASDLAGRIEKEIEDASFEWNPQQYPFVDVARITIPPQDFYTADLCERLTFSPWHGLAEHRPLGGINRLRRAVYEASSHQRLGSKGTGG